MKKPGPCANAVLKAVIELLKVRTLITLGIVGATIWGFVSGRVPLEVFAPMAMAVLTHYFRKGKDE
jgi:hypothetical protein